MHCDITSPDSVKELVTGVMERYKRVDGLVNNAYPRTRDWGVRFEDVPYDSWQKNVDMQMNSVFLLCQTVLKYMKVQGSGSIVNIGSIYGVVGNDFTIYEGYGGTSLLLIVRLKEALSIFPVIWRLISGNAAYG